MSNAIATTPTLVDAVWRTDGQKRLLRNLVLMIVGTALMTISAKINVPMIPVPMTMQTFAVLVIGMAYGWKLGGATILAYLAEGAMGLPVFASGGGLAYMAGPTGGYLFGFLIATLVVGWLAERGWDRGPVQTFAANAIGTALIFGFGALYLTHLIAMSSTAGDYAAAFSAAIAAGVAPFLIGAVAKIALAAAVLPMAWRLLGKQR